MRDLFRNTEVLTPSDEFVNKVLKGIPEQDRLDEEVNIHRMYYHLVAERRLSKESAEKKIEIKYRLKAIYLRRKMAIKVITTIITIITGLGAIYAMGSDAYVLLATIILAKKAT